MLRGWCFVILLLVVVTSLLLCCFSVSWCFGVCVEFSLDLVGGWFVIGFWCLCRCWWGVRVQF